MKNIVLLILIAVPVWYLSAQPVTDGNFLYDLNGKPISLSKHEYYSQGSPFFSDGYLPGRIMLSDGKIISNIRLRINLLKNEILYKLNDEQEMEATGPVKKVILRDSAGGREIHFASTTYLSEGFKPKNCWLEELETGKASLYRNYTKEVQDVANYGSASKEKMISTTEKIFLLFRGKWHQVKRVKDLPDILTDKKEALKKLIAENRMETNSETELRWIVAFYNSEE